MRGMQGLARHRRALRTEANRLHFTFLGTKVEVLAQSFYAKSLMEKASHRHKINQLLMIMFFLVFAQGSS